MFHVGFFVLNAVRTVGSKSVVLASLIYFLRCQLLKLVISYVSIILQLNIILFEGIYFKNFVHGRQGIIYLSYA